MFKIIYRYEINYWLRQPVVYIYAIFLLLAGFITVSGMAAEDTERFGGRVINAPALLYDMTRRYLLLVSLLLPSLIGHSVDRDFSSHTYRILYVFPMRTMTYIGAKFLSSFTILLCIVLMLEVGYYVGTLMPWVNPELVQPFRLSTYLQQLGVVIVPNLFLWSSIVFGVVLLTRSVPAGFVTVLLLFVLPMLGETLLRNWGSDFWISLLDPTGAKAVNFYIARWTVDERNRLLLPVHGYVLYNRLFWSLVAVFLFVVFARIFRFSQNALTFRKKKSEGGSGINVLGNRIVKVVLPRLSYDFSAARQIGNIWKLSMFEFIGIISSRSFQILVFAGLVFVLLAMASVNPRWDTETLPRTWQMLELPSQLYSGVINLITFLYAGILVQRGRKTGMDQLIDINPVFNAVMALSKLLVLIKLQALLLLLVMIGGIATQIWKGYYEFELGQYIFNLFGLNLIHFVIWAMLALFVQTLLNNTYLGFFLLLMVPVGCIGLAEIGPQQLNLHFFEQMMFRYNQAPGGVFGLRYSEMDGYGPLLPAYFLYKLYWALAGILFMIGALLFWQRGLAMLFRERLRNAVLRFRPPLSTAFLLTFIAFAGLGTTFFYYGNIARPFLSRPQKQALLLEAIAKYKTYENFLQPKITDVVIEMNIFPESRQYSARGSYTLVNKTDRPIDTLIVNYLSGTNCTYDFDRELTPVSRDNIANFGNFDILVMGSSLQPGDSMQMNFQSRNDRVTALHTNDFVKKHGTFIKDDVFPRLGNWLFFLREANGLLDRRKVPHPADSSAHFHSFIALDADRVNFEAMVSTSADQMALAPGALQDSWEEAGRRYFHYKTDQKIALTYLFTSGRYAVAKDKWKDVELEIYYDENHPYNIHRWMAGMKAGLDYCTEHFGPYQFRQLRIAEFAQTGGASAHGFPGFIPAGEGSGFIADTDDSPDGGTDYAFGTSVHEVAHQWWGQQVIPSAALGAKFVAESMAEYTNVMVKKKEKGIRKMLHYLEHSHQSYLKRRVQDRQQESPLIFASNDQNYVVYPKGAIVLYALSQYVGEEKLNRAIRDYVEKTALREDRYASSIELAEYIEQVVPDSLQYLIKDQLETVTLYDNRIAEWSAAPLPDGRYRVDIEFIVRKYRSGPLGQPIFSDNRRDSLVWKWERSDKALLSLPLADYIDLAVYGADGQELYLNEHKATAIDNRISITVNEMPEEVALDPLLKLIDRSLEDNRSKNKSIGER